MTVNVVVAINSMNKRRHNAHVYRHQGKMWVEIDQGMLASFDEIEELVDGVHSFDELAQLACGGTGRPLTSLAVGSILTASLGE